MIRPRTSLMWFLSSSPVYTFFRLREFLSLRGKEWCASSMVWKIVSVTYHIYKGSHCVVQHVHIDIHLFQVDGWILWGRMCYKCLLYECTWYKGSQSWWYHWVFLTQIKRYQVSWPIPWGEWDQYRWGFLGLEMEVIVWAGLVGSCLWEF